MTSSMDFDSLVRAKKELRDRIDQLRLHLNPDKKKAELISIENETLAKGFWDNPALAKPLLKRRGAIMGDLDLADRLQKSIDNLEVGLELSKDDASMLEESVTLEHAARELVQDSELRMMLSGDLDTNNAVVSISPGAGGTESCDWAAMLLRMYLRFCEMRGWPIEINDHQAGDEAGIKGVTFSVKAPYSYGYLRAEAGVHRLVRISPFDSAKRRHTSFAAVYVSPELDETIDIEIPEKDLRIDVFRASGAGGQHVNRTESAVRFTHLPSGLVVSCQNERSQIQNRETAMKILKGRIYELEQRKLLEKISQASGEKSDVAWGSQIRSYVLAPYQLVKDHRTQLETSQTQKVLDGDLEDFIRKQLLAKASRRT